MRPTDRAHIESMQRLLFPTPANYLASLDEGQWWIATAPSDDGFDLAGFCAVAPSRQWTDCAYLSRAGVMPAFRGQGLQRRFIRTRLAWARANGYRFAITETTANNCPSINNLIDCGFKAFDPPRPWAADGACYWTLDLNRKTQ